MLNQIDGVTEEEAQEAIDYFYSEFPAWRGLLDDWLYDNTHRFKNPTTDKRIAESRIRDLADKLENSFDDYILDLTDKLEEDGNVEGWGDDLADTLLLVAIMYYLLGRGGLSQMAETDWESVTREVNSQYSYLQGFADAIGGGLSKAQINSRTAMYFASLHKLYDVGRSSSFGLILPAYPRDGSSECKIHCGCSWRIVEYDDRWECFWERTAVESCPTCVKRSSEWYPYIAYK